MVEDAGGQPFVSRFGLHHGVVFMQDQWFNGIGGWKARERTRYRREEMIQVGELYHYREWNSLLEQGFDTLMLTS